MSGDAFSLDTMLVAEKAKTALINLRRSCLSEMATSAVFVSFVARKPNPRQLLSDRVDINLDLELDQNEYNKQ